MSPPIQFPEMDMTQWTEWAWLDAPQVEPQPAAPQAEPKKEWDYPISDNPAFRKNPSLLLALPDELWLRIAANLPSGDLARLSRAVTNWQRNRSFALLNNIQPDGEKQPAFHFAAWLNECIPIQRISVEEKRKLFDKAAAARKWEIVRLMLETDVQFLTTAQANQIFLGLRSSFVNGIAVFFTASPQIIEKLLREREDISREAATRLLRDTWDGETVRVILRMRKDILANEIEEAFLNSARLRPWVVSEFLHERKDITGNLAGKTLLNILSYGKEQYFEAFLDQWGPIITSADAGNALVLAAINKVEFLRILLEKRIDISGKDLIKALVEATKHDRLACVRLLIDKKEFGIEAMKKAIAWAALRGSLACLRFLLQEAGDIPSKFVGNMLVIAAVNGHVECVRLLLQRTDISSNHAGEALWRTAKFGTSECARLLLETRPDISAVRAGKALWKTVKYGHLECVRILLAARKDISTADALEALRCAATSEYGFLCVRFLLQEREDFSIELIEKLLRVHDKDDPFLKESRELILKWLAAKRKS